MALFEAVGTRAGALAGLLALLCETGPAAADPILTLSSETETVELSLEDLKALPQHSVTTATEFTDGAVTFTGPLARDVLDEVGLAQAETVRLTAMNDYFIDVPTRDFAEYDVIMALEADGKRLSRRDKGPIWLMYPLDDYEELGDPIYNARLIWQLVSVEEL
jgi:hypothetical protein